MNKPKEVKNRLVGLDIGTSKVVAVVADVSDHDSLEVVGFGQVPSHGLKRGMVVNIESTVQSIKRAIDDAQRMADCKIHWVFTGIAGGHIRSMNSQGMVAIKAREVTQQDIDRVIETARAVSIPPDHEVLHIVTQEYSIDGQEGVKEPIGMSGVRLEAKVHIVTGAVSAVQNVTKCVRRCGLEVAELILQPMASAIAVLSDDEKEMGVCLVDMGGGTTDIAVYLGGAIRHTAVIPIAGDQITNDIAVALRTTTKEAEEIKILHGVARAADAEADKVVEIPGVGDRKPRQMAHIALAEVIEPRVEELFQLVRSELRRAGFENNLVSGVVLTGGAASMPSMAILAEEIFHLPVRIGIPKCVGGVSDMVRNPRFSTSIGLLMYSQGQLAVHHEQKNDRLGILTRMKNWFANNF
ncbi:MAG: cell division protein FtsA [Neisseriales bacterium]|nr:MAG: cell division protein FtsA [Neisseriales bacterium]